MRSFITCMLHQLLLADQIKKNSMGGASSTHKELKMHTKFQSGNLKGRNHLEDVDMDEIIIK